ncbi:MAG: AmmeMemoRadiSam system protein A [Caldimicrobium thiodismutans]
MLSKEEKIYLLKLCREVLKAYFQGKVFKPEPPLREKCPHLYEKRGVFVTLKKGGRLRGCIGTLEGEKPLYEEVCEVVLNSAFRDPRFPPLEKKELDEIEIEISILSPFVRAKPEEVEVGKHGIFLKKGPYRGLLLPQVATEYNWDRRTFLRQGCLKAGLSENCWEDPETELYLFTAEVFSEREIF